MLPSFRTVLAALGATLIVLVAIVAFLPTRLPLPLSGRDPGPVPYLNGEMRRLLSMRIGPTAAGAREPRPSASSSPSLSARPAVVASLPPMESAAAKSMSRPRHVLPDPVRVEPLRAPAAIEVARPLIVLASLPAPQESPELSINLEDGLLVAREIPQVDENAEPAPALDPSVSIQSSPPSPLRPTISPEEPLEATGGLPPTVPWPPRRAETNVSRAQQTARPARRSLVQIMRVKRMQRARILARRAAAARRMARRPAPAAMRPAIQPPFPFFAPPQAARPSARSARAQRRTPAASQP